MPERKFLVRAGFHNRIGCPISIHTELPEDVRGAKLQELGSGREVPCQIDIVEGRARISWIENMLKGEEREYRLSASQRGEAPVQAGIIEKPGRIEMTIQGKLFTAYNFQGDLPRPFIHPVIGPYGGFVTRGFPMIPDAAGEVKDHPHHRSVWVAHGDVNGVDNWSEEKGHGRTIHREFEAMRSGPVMSEIVALGDWVSRSGERVLSEKRTIRVYNTPEIQRIMDVDVELVPTSGDVTFGDTKEGGIISVRVASSMDVERGGKIQNSYGGINESETWGKRAHWCDYSGPVEGKWVGIAVFDHTLNFRHPVYWHVRDYGLMTANPFGISYFTNDPSNKGTYILRAGDKLSFRYRLLIHGGDAGEANLTERYHDYVNPPSVSMS